METTAKIDIHDSVRTYERSRSGLLSDRAILPANIQSILEFLDARGSGIAVTRESDMTFLPGRTKKHGRISVRSRDRYLYYLKAFALYFPEKDFSALNERDVADFVVSLDSDRVQSIRGKMYSAKTKSNIKKTLVLFLRWLFGEYSQRAHKMTFWIDTRYRKKTVLSLSEDEVNSVLSACKTVKERMLIVCLFDGGFRIEEFLNIRYSDVSLIDGKAPYYRFTVRDEFSKTKGRSIPMLWSKSQDIISRWIALNPPRNPEDPLFPTPYSAVAAMLNEIATRAGTRHLHPHLFRHSSATYYAAKGWNEFQLNLRYGWASTSDMGRHYVDVTQIHEERHIRAYEEEQLALKEKQKRQSKGNRRTRTRTENRQKDNAPLKQELLSLKDEMAQLKVLIAGIAQPPVTSA